MAEAKLGHDTALSDHRVSPEVSHASMLHAEYVDDFATFGLTADLVEEALQRAVGVTESAGCPVKGVKKAATHGDFTGVRFDGARGRASVTPQRIWRLRFAILELLKLGRSDGVRLMKLIGHFTYVALLRRGTLCIFSAVYAFVRAAGGSSARMWPCGASWSGPSRSCRRFSPPRPAT